MNNFAVIIQTQMDVFATVGKFIKDLNDDVFVRRDQPLDVVNSLFGTDERARGFAYLLIAIGIIAVFANLA